MSTIDDGLCVRCGRFLDDWEDAICDRCLGRRDLVVLDRDRCPVDGLLLVEGGMDEPALFIHGGYGATRRTRTWHCRLCGWSITREVSEVSPRGPV